MDRNSVDFPVRRYCTYFDSAYASRGLVMMASLLRFQPNARITVLCLDETAFQIIAGMSRRQPAVIPLRLDELEAFDPQLAACRHTRSKVEYYFTCTPCLPRYVLAADPGADMVTYLDADLFFYDTPELVFDEIGAAPVAITPHRFSPENALLVENGMYNVAWISWRRDAEGLRCLEEYRADCLDWCHDRIEETRFADQKYLDTWPRRYAGVRELAGKGIDLALWNVGAHALTHEDGRLSVDGEPLVFFHFHGVKHVGRHSFDVRFADYHVRPDDPVLWEHLFRPYLGLVDSTFDGLAGAYGLKHPGDPRHGDGHQAPLPPVGVSGDYQVIDRAAALAGTDDDDDGWLHADVAERQDAAYEGLLGEMRAGRPRADFIVAATAVHTIGLPVVSLLEVGCASGYYADVFDHVLNGRVDYSGIDRSPALIDLGRRRRPGVRLDVADATRLPFPDAAFDVVFNGVALMHIPDYEAAIAESSRVASRFCIFHTVPVLTRRPTTFLRKRAYGRAVTEIILNESELRLLLARHGLAVRQVWDSIAYDLAPVVGESTPTRTYLCERVATVAPDRPALLNIGCGGHFHQDWLNIDVNPRSPEVLDHTVMEPLRFPDGTFDAVYHSHVLEHLPKAYAPAFLAGCLRVLKPGGVIRIAIPDLERIARLYVELLDKSLAGDQAAADRYDWIMLELFDQMVRNESGGDMVNFLRQEPLPAEDFIIERIGREGTDLIAGIRAGGGTRPAGMPLPYRLPRTADIGQFRVSGEVHQWMYDRFSLIRLLEQVGFADCRVVPAEVSAIPCFAGYGLDVEPDGRVRKPDSLFIEARKPAA